MPAKKNEEPKYKVGDHIQISLNNQIIDATIRAQILDGSSDYDCSMMHFKQKCKRPMSNRKSHLPPHNPAKFTLIPRDSLIKKRPEAQLLTVCGEGHA